MLIDRHDLSLLLVCSLRYALGRHSTIVGQVAGTVRAHYGKLSRSDRAVVIRDVEQHVTLDARLRADDEHAGCDHECDRIEWAALLAWMRATKETAC